MAEALAQVQRPDEEDPNFAVRSCRADSAGISTASGTRQIRSAATPFSTRERSRSASCRGPGRPPHIRRRARHRPAVVEVGPAADRVLLARMTRAWCRAWAFMHSAMVTAPRASRMQGLEDGAHRSLEYVGAPTRRRCAVHERIRPTGATRRGRSGPGSCGQAQQGPGVNLAEDNSRKALASGRIDDRDFPPFGQRRAHRAKHLAVPCRQPPGRGHAVDRLEAAFSAGSAGAQVRTFPPATRSRSRPARRPGGGG